MAEEGKKQEAKKGEEAAAPAPAAPAKSNKKIIFIAAGLVGLVVLIGVPVAFFSMQEKKEDSHELSANSAQDSEHSMVPEGTHDEDELLEGEEALGAFFPLEAFVVNLSGGRFIRCQVQLEFAERDVPKRFYARLIPVRDAIIGILTRRTQDDVLSDKGKENLKKDIKDMINELLKKEDVKQVYFTQFVIQ